MITKKQANEMKNTIDTLLSQNKALLKQNKILKERNAELSEICAFVDKSDPDGYNRIVSKIKEGNLLKAQWEESIRQAIEAKKKYDSLYRELFQLKEKSV